MEVMKYVLFYSYYAHLFYIEHNFKSQNKFQTDAAPLIDFTVHFFFIT